MGGEGAFTVKSLHQWRHGNSSPDQF
jgi:hypothetical protein